MNQASYLSADTKEATQQEEVHLKLAVHLRELAHLTQYLMQQSGNIQST
jgi:hypothetical protein